MNKKSVCFGHKFIQFQYYAYPPATVFRNGRITRDLIRDFDATQAPPEVRTQKGEVLAIPAPFKDELIEWSRKHELPAVSRVDVWSLLLEPFLDTTFDEKHQQSTIKSLASCGVSVPEIEEIRGRVADAMVAYNFGTGLWDWVNLGLFDVLDAHSGGLMPWQHKLPASKFKEFYWQAMELAERGARILS